MQQLKQIHRERQFCIIMNDFNAGPLDKVEEAKKGKIAPVMDLR